MNYQEAMQHALKVDWKVSLCHEGKECWCRVIEPKEKIISSEDEEIYIVGSGSISKEHAEHIVNVHNCSLKTLDL